MDISAINEEMVKSFVYGFFTSGLLLVTFSVGNAVKGAFALLHKITK